MKDPIEGRRNKKARWLFSCGYLQSARTAVRSLLAASVIISASASNAPAQIAKIIGWGSASCIQFVDNVAQNHAAQNGYFSWAQGYMSGILMTRPPGVDENLNLNPPTFPWTMQFDFLHTYCVQRKDAEFSDAVEALYKRLRAAQTAP